VSVSMVQRGAQPSVIAMCSSGSQLDSISTTYTDMGGEVMSQPVVHGHPTQAYPALQFGPREQVSSVAIQYMPSSQNPYGVNRLTITTNYGQTVSVPPTGGAWFSSTWNVSATSRFMGWAGFFGGSWIGGICIRFVNFRAARWDTSVQPARQVGLATVAEQIKPTVVAPLEKPANFAQGHMPTETEAVYTIQQWARVNCGRIVDAYEQKGGWEGWAQVELALAFQSYYGGLRVSREVNIFTSRKRADFVLCYRGETTQLFEIKCASSGQDAFSSTTPPFAKALQADIAKVMTNSIRSEYGATLVSIMGISPNADSYGAILSGAYNIPIKLVPLVEGKLWMWYGSFTRNVGGSRY